MKHASNRQVRALVDGIRRRWRRRALVQGGALALLTLLTAAALALALRVYAGAGAPVLWTVGAVGALAFAVVVALFVVRPLRRDLSDRRIALFVEERVPGLEDRLNSAVEVGAGAPGVDEALVGRLVDDAAARVVGVAPATLLDRQRERAFGAAAVVALVVFLPFAYTALRTVGGAAGLALPAVAEPVALFTVSPGTVEVEQGASQEVVVTVRESARHDVVLHWQEGDGPWQRAAMEGAADGEAFLHAFYSIQDSIQYYVSYGEDRSPPYLLALYEFPAVEGVDAVYAYPEYTRTPPRRETDVGDLSGLRGSSVTLTARTRGTVERAEVVLDDGRTVALEPQGAGRFRGALTLDEDGAYHLRLTDAQGKVNRFPDRHLILPYDDAPPTIALEAPGGDVRANAVEEVLVAVRVQDDFAVEGVRLRYVVGAGEERTVDLARAEAGAAEVTGEHLFYLEDYGLAPGDVVSYYVEAEDGFHERATASDMYFVEVIPFDQQFRQQANAGGGAGAGGASGIVLSQQEIINATWKLHRARPTTSADVFEETRGGLVQAQRNLRENIMERLNNTAFSLELRMDDASRGVADHLRDAVDAMARAVDDLGEGELQRALTPQREALTHLLKADALNKERQVAAGGQQSGQGGGAGMEERMTELMDLELDVSKDKYEIQQPAARGGQGGGQQQPMDEALQKIKDLARKQQNLAAQSRNEREDEAPGRSIERLQREQDALREEVQDLTRSMRAMQNEQRRNGQTGQSGQTGQTGQTGQGGRNGSEAQARAAEDRLRRAAESMRAAEEALRRGDLAEAEARQAQALNELDRLAQDLRLAGRDDARELLDELAEGFEALRERERQMARDLRAAARNDTPDPETLARLRENRRAMQDNLRRFSGQAEAVAERMRQEDPAVANEAQNLLRRLEREKVDEAMEASEEALRRGWTDFAARKQDEIEAALDRVGEGVRALEGRLPVTEEEAVARGLADVRDLMERLEDLRDQAAELREGSEEGGSGQAQSGGEGGQGEGGRGRAAGERRLEGDVRAAREALERIERDHGDNPAFREALSGLRNTLGRSDFTGRLLEGDEADAFFDERVYAPLSGLELDLAGRLDGLALDKKLYGARKADAPEGYQALVERYYERLSRGRQ